MPREGWRRAISVACLVIASILGPLGVIAAWANTTLYDSNTLRNPDGDPVQVQATLRALLQKKLGSRLASAAAAFDRDHPELDGQFDLGTVAPEVATSSGYGCLTTS